MLWSLTVVFAVLRQYQGVPRACRIHAPARTFRADARYGTQAALLTARRVVHIADLAEIR